jgi:hypothetical protein
MTASGDHVGIVEVRQADGVLRECLSGLERGRRERGAVSQLAAPSAALTLAMIAPPIAMEMNELRKPVAKKRHRIQARATSSKAIVASATASATR